MFMTTAAAMGAVAALATTASASPAAPAAPTLFNNYNASFDEYPSGDPPLPYIPGPYDGVYFNTSGTIFCGPDCIVFPLTYPNDILTTAGFPASMNAQFNNSKTAFFDLHQFAMGCYAEQTVQTGPTTYGRDNRAINCTMTVEGWHGPKVGPPQVSQAIEYRPETYQNYVGVPGANMNLYNVSSAFTGLRFVQFTPSLAKDSKANFGGLTGLLDNISYRVYNFTA